MKTAATPSDAVHCRAIRKSLGAGEAQIEVLRGVEF